MTAKPENPPATGAEVRRMADEHYARLTEIYGRVQRGLITPLVAIMLTERTKPNG